MSATPIRKQKPDNWPPYKNSEAAFDDMEKFNEAKLIAAVRRRFPGGPRQALRGLGFDENLEALSDDRHDLTRRLETLRGMLAAYMPPEQFEDASEDIADLIGRIAAIVRAADAAENRKTLDADGQDDDEPPPNLEPRGLAGDTLPAAMKRIGVLDASGTGQRHDHRAAMHANMRRVGIDGGSPPRPDTLDRLHKHMQRIGQV